MELEISTSSNDVFLYPSVALDDPTAAPDPSLTVTEWSAVSGNKAAFLMANIKLTIPPKTKPPEKLLALSLTVNATEFMAFPSGFYETNIVFNEKLPVPSATDFALQAGSSYNWDVPVLLPCNAAPYERGSHGRNYWTLTAKATFPGLISQKKLTAEKNLFIVQAPLDQQALSYDHVHSGFAEGLGQVQSSFISRSFTVGGYLRGALLLPAPAPGLKLHSISMALVQTVSLLSRKRTPRHVETCLPETYEFMRLKGEELENEVIHTGALCRARPSHPGSDEIEIEWITKLPTDNQARPTTILGGDAHIRLNHQIEFAIVYDIDGANPERDSRGQVLRKRYRVTWPVNLTSCALRWRSLVLPEYSATDTNPVPSRDRNVWRGRTEHETQDHCNCGEGLEELVGYEDEAEAQTNVFTTALMRQLLISERSTGAAIGGTSSASRSRHRGTRRADANGSGRGTATSSPSRSRTRQPRDRSTARGLQAGVAGSRSASLTPRTPRGRSRAVTPDRISIDFERDEEESQEWLQGDDIDEEASSDGAQGGEAWDEEEDEELMDKLERERQKREQLYTTQFEEMGLGSSSAAAGSSRHQQNSRR